MTGREAYTVKVLNRAAEMMQRAGEGEDEISEMIAAVLVVAATETHNVMESVTSVSKRVEALERALLDRQGEKSA